jgi:acylphosphatase
MATVHLLIKGKVQGVFFRATAKEIAESLGITGWIKNTDEGYVESIAIGSEEKVQKFIEWCKHGPPKARVMDLVITYIEDQYLSNFKIIRG